MSLGSRTGLEKVWGRMCCGILVVSDTNQAGVWGRGVAELGQLGGWQWEEMAWSEL